MRRHLQRYVGDTAVADDLLQETLIRVARGLEGFDGRSSIKTWAFSIASRVAADHFRKPGIDTPQEEVDESAWVDPEPPVDERMVVAEMNDCVRQVIDGLAPDYRAALVLHDLEGLTAQDTANACGCSVPTAKIRIHRARQRLRQALEDECRFYRDHNLVFRCTKNDDCAQGADAARMPRSCCR